MFYNESAEFSMAKYDYVIFDFDGTVVDTGEEYSKAYSIPLSRWEEMFPN